MEREGGHDARQSSAGSREVALFGGSFNPPHIGHVYVIAHVLATQPVDELWLVPTHTHAFGKELAPFEARLDMCRKVAAIFGPKVSASGVEADFEARASFTIDTLEHLQRKHRSHRFALVIGSDNLGDLNEWKEADRLRRMVRLIVINRSGYPMEGEGPAIPDVSSTWVRERLRLGEDVSGWVPSIVAEYCKTLGLYGQS